MSNPVATCFVKKNMVPASTQEILFAARKLNGAAFKLYIYFALLHGPEIYYERAIMEKILNTNRTTLNRAFEELCINNYLIQSLEKVYIFYTSPEQNIQEHGQGDNLYTESMKEQ